MKEPQSHRLHKAIEVHLDVGVGQTAVCKLCRDDTRIGEGPLEEVLNLGIAQCDQAVASFPIRPQSAPEVPYDRWIDVTAMIEDAGGIITLQLEEEREVMLPE